MNRHHLTGATAYISAAVNIPTVRAIPGHPGVYILCFGDDLDLHATAAQWDAIDTAVRNGILAAQTLLREAVAKDLAHDLRGLRADLQLATDERWADLARQLIESGWRKEGSA